MKSKQVQYKESHKLSLNVFLLFYIYLLVIIILANIAPVSATSYCIFFILGLAGILILFLRATYAITVRKNILEVSITLLTRIIIKRLDLSEAESIEELPVDGIPSTFKIKKSPGSIAYLIRMPTAVKITMPGKENYIIATANPTRLLNVANSLNK